MSSPTVPQCKVSTDQSPPRLRLSYWEAHNSSELVGLKCSSHASEGLSAHEHNFDLGAIKLADIRGNEHVIERTPALLRRFPKDSTFIALFTEGDGFFYQRGHSLKMKPGEVLIYTTSQPYLCGFGRTARQLLVDIPAQLLHEKDDQWGLRSRPIKVDGTLIGERSILRELDRLLLGFAAAPLAHRVPQLTDRVRALGRAMLAPHSKPSVEVSAHVRRLQAEAFIVEKLGDPSLDAATVARHVCISTRHLSRIFEDSNCTPTEWIWNARLAAASRMLIDPLYRFVSIGDVGFQSGFSSAAHFSHAFKTRYGLTPSQHRQSNSSSS